METLKVMREVFGKKLLRLAISRRFWVAVGGVLVVFLNENFGLDEESAKQVVTVLAAWIVGDSINKT